MTRVLVVGGSGFIGSAVLDALTARGAEVRAVSAPRLSAVDAAGASNAARTAQPTQELIDKLNWSDVVINAAGVADPGQSDERKLVAANAAMPAMVARLARDAGVGRFVHFSTAAVQGDRAQLDASDDFRPFSPYSRSKILGEQLLTELNWPDIVLYRPQGVHGPGRQVTRTLAAVARSPLASVASPGDQPTPQAFVGSVADAAAFLALTDNDPQGVVIHPWEGVTTDRLLNEFGGKRPVHIPARPAAFLVAVLRRIGRHQSRVASNARRLQMIWFGQSVAPSWLTAAGWLPKGGSVNPG